MAVATDWEGLWAKGLKPGERFDICGAHPVLQHLLAAGKVPNGTAFVPGCGRGYDLAALATPERLVIGLEYSSTAASLAREYLLSRGVGKQAQVHEGDFFEFSHAPVDAVYDYTFFCAIPLARRAEWGAKMAELVRPGGVLITLQFPLVSPPGRAPDDFTTGPPFLLRVEDYQAVLAEAFVCEEAQAVPAEMSDPRRVGAERWALWRRK